MRKIPVPLMFIAIVGLIAPVIMIVSSWSNLHDGKTDDIVWVKFLIVCVCALVVFLSSMGLFLRKSYARWFYLLGWGLTCLSPLLWVEINKDLALAIPPIIFNLLIGLGLFLYFIRSSEVKAYFTVPSNHPK